MSQITFNITARSESASASESASEGERSISTVFAGETVGIRKVDDKIWLAWGAVFWTTIWIL
ncbi:Uncharacterised protein [Halioglobus japonicus]|nr:Uncharacterised protein [Halioglobus japonicus]